MCVTIAMTDLVIVCVGSMIRRLSSHSFVMRFDCGGIQTTLTAFERKQRFLV